MSLPEDGTAILQNCAKASDPPMIQYHDGTGTLLEIFIPSGTYKQAMSLIEEQDWEALSQFPRWSDQPALESGQPNVMRYNDPRTGKDREIYLPLGTLKTASQLLMAEDWEGLGKNFMVYTGQVREDSEMIREHQRGVERMAREREAKPAPGHGTVDG